MHPVFAELADRIAGSGGVALGLVALHSTALDRHRGGSSSGSDQEHFVSASPVIGIQDLVEEVSVAPKSCVNSEGLYLGHKTHRD